MSGLVNSRRSGDRTMMAVLVIVIFIGIGTNAMSLALQARQTQDIKEITTANGRISGENKRLLEQFVPCDPVKDPKSAACQRDAASQKRVDEAVSRLAKELVGGIEAHDLNAHNEHENLLKQLGIRNALPPRQPITQSKETTLRSTTRNGVAGIVPASVPAPTTTTTCPKRGKSDVCAKG